MPLANWSSPSGGGGGSSSATPFDPTSVDQEIVFHDEMTGYQSTTSNGSIGYWVTASGAGTLCQRSTLAAGDKGRVGVYVFSGGSATGYGGWIGDCSFGRIFGTGTPTYTIATAIKIDTLPTVSEDFYMNFGFSNTFPNYQHGAVITVDRTLSTTNFFAVTSKASTVTSADTSVKFYIDGALTNTITTNIPNAAGQVVGSYLIAKKVAGSAAQNLYCDYITEKIQLSAARGTF